MSSYKSPGDCLTLVAPYARASAGLGAKVGAIFGVSTTDVGSGDEGVFCVSGVHEILKVGSQAWAQGDRIYWNDSSKYCTNDSAAGMFIGVATEAVGSGAGETTGTVKLCPSSELTEGPQAAEAALTGSLTGTVNGALVDVAATAGSCAGAGSPNASNVDTAIATAVASIVTGVNEQNKEMLTKINAILAKLVLAGILDA